MLLDWENQKSVAHYLKELGFRGTESSGVEIGKNSHTERDMQGIFLKGIDKIHQNSAIKFWFIFKYLVSNDVRLIVETQHRFVNWAQWKFKSASEEPENKVWTSFYKPELIPQMFLECVTNVLSYQSSPSTWEAGRT